MELRKVAPDPLRGVPPQVLGCHFETTARLKVVEALHLLESIWIWMAVSEMLK